jgi:hypothetical protein
VPGRGFGGTDVGGDSVARPGKATPMWDHLRMDPKDDPEARIRELERSLNEQARTSELGGGSTELGTGSPGAGSGQYGYVPPPPGGSTYPLPPPPPPPGAYDQSYAPPPGGYGSYPPPASFGGPFNPTVKKSGFPTGWILAIVALVVLVPLIGGLYAVFAVRDTISSIPSFSPPSFPSFSPPSFPSSVGQEPSAIPTVGVGDSESFAGSGNTEKLVCDDGGAVTISGFSNVIEITGHCSKVSVSGVQNKITVDSAEVISASGVNNSVIYHSGSPQVDNGGNGNTVDQG